ncbi:MAG: DUF1501 domain-containing protein, partial [Planctomycetota bacterium]
SGLSLPVAAAVPALFARALLAAPEGDRVLVLLQLTGGNDGLNAVVPFEDDAYHRARPGIGVRADQVIRLGGGVGLNPALAGLREAWDAGALAVLQGVGYPNPNRSHFASTDIWHTARTEVPERWTGWIGRALDRCCGADATVPGLQLDDGPLSLALVGERVVVPAVSDADRFRVLGGERASEMLPRLLEGPEGCPTRELVRQSARQAYRTSAALEGALKERRGLDAYPQSTLASRLWQVARLVEARLPARVYAVSLAGFDTHSRQRAAHDALLKVAGDAVGAFHKDLRARGLADRVLLVTYSEFGRRVAENRSLGTDHGAAAPMFVVGGAVKGGVHGAHPSLAELEEGDLKHHTDFRGVYATILHRWIGVEPGDVLRGDFPRVPFL